MGDGKIQIKICMKPAERPKTRPNNPPGPSCKPRGNNLLYIPQSTCMPSTPTEKSSGLHSLTGCAFYLLEHIHQRIKKGKKNGKIRGEPNADKDTLHHIHLMNF